MMILLFAKNKKKRSANCEECWGRFESGMKIKFNSPVPKLIFFYHDQPANKYTLVRVGTILADRAIRSGI